MGLYLLFGAGLPLAFGLGAILNWNVIVGLVATVAVVPPYVVGLGRLLDRWQLR
jgi:hypothetical protein